MYLAIAIQLSIICLIQSATQTDTPDCSGCCTSAGGIPGIPGNHGTPGAPGPIGMKGDVGVKGAKGNQGIDGLQGKIGPIGLPGITGEKGVRGDIGRDGVPGKIGPTGLPGTTEKGRKGEKGGKGEKGELNVDITNSQPKSAFSVGFNENPGRHPISPMKYSRIYTNVGIDYSKETGKFVCEHPGTYIFQFTSGSSNAGKIVTSIMKNGQRTVSAMEDGSNYNSVTNMVILDLEANDEVWTEPANTFSNYYNSHSYVYCTFSGFLLYATT